MRREFVQRPRARDELAIWRDGVWEIPGRIGVTGSLRVNEFLLESPGQSHGPWAGWDWLALVEEVSKSRPSNEPFAVTGNLLRAGGRVD